MSESASTSAHALRLARRAPRSPARCRHEINSTAWLRITVIQKLACALKHSAAAAVTFLAQRHQDLRNTSARSPAWVKCFRNNRRKTRPRQRKTVSSGQRCASAVLRPSPTSASSFNISSRSNFSRFKASRSPSNWA
jgi:hypothetical protein